MAMDRETAVKLWREIGLGMPGGGATRRLIEAFAVAVEAAERERCAKAVRNIGADHFGRQHGRAEDPRVTAAAIARWIEGREA